MPFLYPVEMRYSSVAAGRGLFALQDIPKGTTYWVFHTQNPVPIKGADAKENRVYSREELQAMTDPTELYELLHVGIYLKHSDAFLVFHDGTQFTNHSLEPNSKAVMPTSKDYTQMISYALKDIKAGEEIFENYEGYLSFEAEWLIKLMEKYNPGCLEFEKEVRNSLEERLQS